MRKISSFIVIFCLLGLTGISTAQEPAATPAAPAIKSVEVTPATSDITVGQKVKFNLVAKDAAGNVVPATAAAWFAAPFDLAGADESGTVSFLLRARCWWAQSLTGSPASQGSR